MAVKYRLDFSTDAGSRKKWRLDILEDGYSGAVLSAKGGSQPIDISWDNQNDAYSPIVASTASIRLIVDSNQNYSEILSGDYGDYEVILRYEDANTPGTYIDYWCGLVVRESYSEHVTSFPYNVTFKATDGLGLLSRDVVGDVTSEGPVTLLSLIQDSLQQIPLPLELRTFSGINNSSDQELLANTSIDPFAFYGNNLSTRPSHLERTEDILLGTNQIVFQSHARWYVVNASNYAAAINSGVENITFKRYNTQGVAQADVTENVVRVITNASDSNIKSVHDNLYTELREPFGSVECHIDNIVSRSLNSNITFVLGTSSTATGWEWYGNIPVAFSTDIFQNGTRSVTTGVTATQDEAVDSDRWFGSVPITTWDRNTPINIDFDYQFDFINPNVTDGEIRYQIVMEIDDDTGGIIFSNIDRWLWDFEANQWHGADSSETDAENFESRFLGRADSSSEGSWHSNNVRINPTWPLRGDNRRLFIRFLSPVALNNASSVLNNGTGLMTTYIDNIRISYDVNTDDQVFELVDDSLTNTVEYEYNTSISSISTDVLYNDLSSETYSRVGVTEDLSLERLVLQQRLNDFRNFSKYYRGSFINNSDVPFSIHNKILVNYTGQSETVSTISKTMSFSPRSNIFNYLGRIPNQATDTAATFHDTDVPLTAPTLELGNTTSYSLTVDLTVTNASSVDISDQFSWDLGAGNNMTSVLSGVPGETKTFPLFINPPAGQVSVINNFTSSGTLPSGVTLGSFQNRTDGALILPVVVTFPRRPDAGTISITGTTIDFAPEETPDAVVASIVVTNNIAGTATPVVTTIPATGRPGDVKNIVYQVDAGTDRIILNPDESHSDTSLSNAIVTGSGSQVASFTFEYTVPTTPESVAVTITGTSSTETDFELNGITKNLVITNNVSNTSIVDGSSNTVVFHGFDGDVVSRNITILPSSNYYITSAPTASYGAGVASAGTIHRSGEDWEIPVDVTISNTASTMTINGNTALEENEIIFNVVSRGTNNATISTDSNIRQTFSSQQFGEDISATIITLIPDEGFSYADTSGIQVDINEAKVRLADGSTVTLPESQFTATITKPGDNILITIAGDFPSLSGIFTIDVTILGGIETIPVVMESVNAAVSEAMDTSVMTNSVRFQTGSSLQPYVYQYVDGDGQTRVNQIFSPDAVDICVAGEDIAASLANASWNSNPGGDGVITTGSGTCNVGTINSDSVNGVMLQVSSTAPSAGTASNVITFVTG